MTRVGLVVALVLVSSAAATHNAPARAAYPGGAGRIAYTRTDPGGSALFSINPDGSGETLLTDADGDSCCPSWSPDGSKIAFYSDRTGNDEVFVMNADGSGARNISTNAAEEGKADWSPDGKKIAFTSDRDGDFEIWVMNADGSGAVQLTHNDAFSDYNPAWSPDGSKIAFERNPRGPSGDREVYVMDAGGGNEVNLTQDPAADGEPEWAPDASRVAFHTDRDGNFEIYSMAPDGSDLQRLTDSPGRDLGPAWSPDGSRIAFASERSGGFQVHVLDMGTMQTAQVTAGAAAATSPDWQPVSVIPLSGDTDCTGLINTVDALQVLRGVAGLPVAGCAFAGDADCDGGRDAIDALHLLRAVVALPTPLLPPGCPAIGEPLPLDPDLAGGALATFTVMDETMRAWVTAPGTVQALHDLAWQRTAAMVPVGPVREGSGQAGHNAPWSWHLDPTMTALGEPLADLCDGLPSDIEDDVDGWIAAVGQFCPSGAVLTELVDYTWMTEAGLPAAEKGD